MSTDNKKTKKQLIEELVELRRQVKQTESRHAQHAGRGENSLATPKGLADTLDDIRDGLVQLDKLGTIVDVNQAAADIFGGSKNELIGKHFTKIGIFSPKEIPGLLGQFKKLLCGRDRESTIQITNKLGRVVHLESSISVRKMADGSMGIVAVVRDVNDRKRAEEELTESESRYRGLFDNATDAVMVFDAKTQQFEDANRATLELFGYTKEQFCQLKVVDISDEKAETVQAVSLVNDTGGCSRVVPERRMIRKDGSVFTAEISAGTFQTRRGKKIIGSVRDITDRKRAEEKVHLLLDYLPCVAMIIKKGTREIVASNSAAREVGAVPGATCYGTCAQRNESCTFCEAPELWKTGKTQDIEVEYDGIWYRGIWVALDEDLYVHYIFDITEHKRVQQELKKSEKRFRGLFQNAPLGYQSLDINGNFLEVNDAWCKTLGYSRDEVIGRNFAEFIDPGFSDMFERCFPKFKDAGAIDGVEHTMVKKDGSTIIASFVGRIGYNSDGSFKQTHCIFADVTERNRAEDALRESEEKFRSITERIYDAIIAVNLGGDISYVSASVKRVFGYVPEELVGMNITELVPEAEIPHVLETFRHNAVGQNVEGHHSEFLKKDGSYASVELNSVPIYKNNKVVGAQAIIRDITETKRLQELESRAARLETAGTIAGQVAHDFNNLLAPLMAYPEFIREELPRNHPALAYLDDIEKSAQKIADINQDLLAMGRRGHYNQEVLNLNAIIHQAVKEMVPQTDNLTCVTDLDPDIMNILGGSSQIHRVVTNLLCNAVDALQNIGHINIRTENYYVDNVSGSYGRVPKGEYVKLTISDTGRGIPDDIVHKILDPFFTTKTSDKRRGSGLGLSVVDAVVKDHNGYLDLETKPGKGTSFYVYFPTTRRLLDDDHTDATCGGCELILIVDDDATQREVSSKLLTKLGYKVSSVESGEKALVVLRDNPHDLVILDMVMPDGIDGTETYRRLLKFSPKQRTIIVSGFSESDRVLEVQKLGAGAFVRKPITRRVIAVAVRTELDKEPQPASERPIGIPAP